MASLEPEIVGRQAQFHLPACPGGRGRSVPVADQLQRRDRTLAAQAARAGRQRSAAHIFKHYDVDPRHGSAGS